MTLLLASATPKALWYLTRGTGVVTLLLLTASIVLGVLTTVRWSRGHAARFLVGGIHRNVTLVAVVFLALHVVTTVADGFAPIRLIDGVLPFASPYRPIWLGLGTVACDLLLALVATSLVRVRLGYRAWRSIHWLAYASWPLALVHALGTGSDARLGWMALLAVFCVAVVGAAVALRLHRSPLAPARRPLAGAAVAVAFVAGAIWYTAGPQQHGWAARAGTPVSLLPRQRLAARLIRVSPQVATALPASFTGRVAGTVQVQQAGGGLVDVLLSLRTRGSVNGVLRITLRGQPIETGGVSMTSSGAAFAAAGLPRVYEGHIVSLSGNRIEVRVGAGGRQVDLALVLDVNGQAGTVSGSVHGTSSGGRG